MQTTWQTYIVGGAVRDELLGLAATEHDYLVVGATPADLLSLGYQQVGKDFPVFLHPQSKAEYALARTERKTAPGYRGFEVHAAPDVTLQQDLLRRDLTINAIAKDEQGKIHDPYQGQQDIQNKLLRHVSDAFTEDPLRVLRLARFHAHLHHLGFSIAPDTLTLAKTIVDAGELATIAKERLWTETYKALQTQSPWVYFATLQRINAWQALAPNMTKLWQPNQQGIGLLQSVCAQIDPPEERLAILLHKLNKLQLEQLGKQLRLPNNVLALCVQLSKHRRQILNYAQLSAQQRYQVLGLCQAFKDDNSLKQLAHLCCVINERGQMQLDDMDLFSKLWQTISTDLSNARQVTAAPFQAQGIQGKAVGEAIKAGRIAAIEQQNS